MPTTDTSEKQPTMMDVAREHKDDAVVSDLLDSIFAHQQKNADFYQSMQDQWTAEHMASVLAIQDGIAAAYDVHYERGGTTASYERVLESIDSVVREATMRGPIRNHYVERILERGLHAQGRIETWPGFIVNGWE